MKPKLQIVEEQKKYRCVVCNKNLVGKVRIQNDKQGYCKCLEHGLGVTRRVFLEVLMKSYSNGEEVRDALETLKAGETVLYRGVVHTVIDAGPVHGMRIASIKQLDALGN